MSIVNALPSKAGAGAAHGRPVIGPLAGNKHQQRPSVIKRKKTGRLWQHFWLPRVGNPGSLPKPEVRRLRRHL